MPVFVVANDKGSSFIIKAMKYVLLSIPSLHPVERIPRRSPQSKPHCNNGIIDSRSSNLSWKGILEASASTVGGFASEKNQRTKIRLMEEGDKRIVVSSVSRYKYLCNISCGMIVDLE